MTEYNEVSALLPQITNAVEANNAERAYEIANTDFATLDDALYATATEMIDFQQARLDENVESAHGTVSTSVIIAIICLIVSVLLLAAMIWYVRKFITSPLTR